MTRFATRRKGTLALARRGAVLLTLCGSLAAPLLPAEDLATARKIQERLVAPCCWQENLATHRSPEAASLRAEILQQIDAGRSESEIVEHFVARYGERILREPRGFRSTLLSVIPWLALGLGCLWILRHLRRITRRQAQASSTVDVLPDLPDLDLEREPIDDLRPANAVASTSTTQSERPMARKGNFQ